MFHHEKLKGRSVGRILYCLEVYCQSNHRLFETARIGDNLIVYNGIPLAKYSWDDDTDIPTLKFNKNISQKHFDESLMLNFERQQYYKKPFLDMPEVLFCINYLVQELKNDLTLSEAMAIRCIRDGFDGEWNDVTVSFKLQDKIKENIQRNSQGCFNSVLRDNWWKHFALCAIYDI